MERFDFITIDPNNLDENWVEQPRLMVEFASKLAKAKVDLERIKAKLDQARAEIKLAFRTNPPEGIKITEGSLTELTESSDRIIQLREQYAVALAEYENLSAIVRSLEHRKSALENLVKLYGSEYFAAPRAHLNDIAKERVRRFMAENLKKQEGSTDGEK